MRALLILVLASITLGCGLAGADGVEKIYGAKITILPPRAADGEWVVVPHQCVVAPEWSPTAASRNYIRVSIETLLDRIPTGHTIYVTLTAPVGTMGTRVTYKDVLGVDPPHRGNAWKSSDGWVDLVLETRPGLEDQELVKMVMDVVIVSDSTNEEVKISEYERCPSPRLGANDIDLNTGLIIGP